MDPLTAYDWLKLQDNLRYLHFLVYDWPYHTCSPQNDAREGDQNTKTSRQNNVSYVIIVIDHDHDASSAKPST
jgi:hypothetical protein